jgi:ribosomal protein L11 methyltransferase
MSEYYYELRATPSGKFELFRDFLNDILPIGYEETQKSFIIRSEENLDTIKWGLEQFAQALNKATSQDIEIDIEIKKYKNDDWIKLYQESIKPLEVGRFYVHPTWDDDKKDYINITIDPALAFGTGHHPTTYTCLEAISKYVSKDDEVCDVGCGSGILAIAALKLGGIVDACDTDEVSVTNAKENAKLNNVSYRKIWQGSITKTDKKYDVIIANIVADVLVFLAKDLKNALKNGNSYLILSGILDKYETKVLNNYKDCNLVQKIQKEEWITLVLQKKDDK